MISENSSSANKILTVPNVLSFFRLALVPLICVLYLVEKNTTLTAIAVLVSGLTDIADGFIARRFNMISDLGKALDPIADKLTQGALLCCIIKHFPNMLILLVVLILKETTTGAASLLATKRTGKVVGAEWHGKITTALLYAVMFVHLLWYEIPPTVSDVLIIICLCVMTLSFVLYAIQHAKSIIKHDE